MAKFDWESTRQQDAMRRYKHPKIFGRTGSFKAKFPGWCPVCQREIAAGQDCHYTLVNARQRVAHEGCSDLG